MVAQIAATHGDRHHVGLRKVPHVGRPVSLQRCRRRLAAYQYRCNEDAGFIGQTLIEETPERTAATFDEKIGHLPVSKAAEQLLEIQTGAPICNGDHLAAGTLEECHAAS